MIKRIADASPRLKARIAVSFLLLLLLAAFTEFFVRGRSSFAAELAAKPRSQSHRNLVHDRCDAARYDIFSR